MSYQLVGGCSWKTGGEALHLKVEGVGHDLGMSEFGSKNCEAKRELFGISVTWVFEPYSVHQNCAPQIERTKPSHTTKSIKDWELKMFWLNLRGNRTYIWSGA